ncbi:MAG: hypothetical protein Fur005_39820 [Roseiflexaceae bacterium]
MRRFPQRTLIRPLMMLVLVSIALPMLAHGASRERANPNPAIINGPTYSFAGINIRVPAGWRDQYGQGGVIGTQVVQLGAPPCSSEPTAGCSSDSQEGAAFTIRIERSENRSTPPGDDLRTAVLTQGYQSQQIILRGMPALELTNPNTGELIIALEYQQVIYHFIPNQALRSQGDLFEALLAAATLDPASAPPAFVADAVEQATPQPAVQNYYTMLSLVVAPEPVLAAAAMFEEAAFRPMAPTDRSNTRAALMVAYAFAYAILRNNSDGCFIFINGLCERPSIEVFDADGAHFIDCALAAMGFPGAKCAREQSNINMEQIRRILVANPSLYAIVPAGQLPQPGDVALYYLRNQSDPCWGGIVYRLDPQSSSGVYVSTHSENHLELDPAAALCNRDRNNRNTQERIARIEYIRPFVDLTPPSVTFVRPAPGRVDAGQISIEIAANDDSDTPTIDLNLVSEQGNEVIIARNSTERSFPVVLDTPCRPVVAMATAFDLAANRADAQLPLMIGLYGDGNRDGQIDTADLDLLFAIWGSQQGDGVYQAVFDVNTDGRIDSADEQALRRSFGYRCSEE